MTQTDELPMQLVSSIHSTVSHRRFGRLDRAFACNDTCTSIHAQPNVPKRRREIAVFTKFKCCMQWHVSYASRTHRETCYRKIKWAQRKCIVFRWAHFFSVQYTEDMRKMNSHNLRMHAFVHVCIRRFREFISPPVFGKNTPSTSPLALHVHWSI